MIFRRRPKADTSSPQSASPASPTSASSATSATSATSAPEIDQWDEFDASRDWRDDGPFDIDEIDLEADEVERLDLGGLIVTPFPGCQVQLLADPESNMVMAAVLAAEGSALQITVLAEPAGDGHASILREELRAQAEAAGHGFELAQGPFGTELRRLITATDADGNEGVAALRDWFIEGPRWVVNARLMGQAAIDVDGDKAAAPFEEAVHNLIVRRGDTAMVPGEVIALQAPAAQG